MTNPNNPGQQNQNPGQKPGQQQGGGQKPGQQRQDPGREELNPNCRAENPRPGPLAGQVSGVRRPRRKEGLFLWARQTLSFGSVNDS